MANCIQSEQDKINAKNFEALAKEFENMPVIKQYGEHALGMWKRIVDMTRDASVGYDVVKSAQNQAPTVEQLKLMRRIMDREVKNLTKQRGSFAKWLYLPQEIFGDVSFVGDWYANVQKSNEIYKGHTQYFNSQLRNMMTELETSARIQGGKLNKIEKELRNKYQEYNKLRLAGKHDRANVLYREIDKYVKEGEAQVLHDFHRIVSGGRDKFAENAATVDPNLRRAARIYLDKIQPKARDIMIMGLKNYRWALQKNQHILGEFENYRKLTNADKTGILDKVIERYESGELQKNGYFPVLSFDVMPTLAKASESLFMQRKNQKTEADFNVGFDSVRKLEKVLNDNIYVNKHLGKQKLEIEGPIDYNVIPIIDSYIRSATRFNYVAYNNGKYMEVMKDIMDTYTKGKNTQLDKKLSFLESYISDHFGLITGEASNSPLASQIARTITATQFASKLGLNVRGAARNATQSLFNYIWFGAKGIQETRNMKRDSQMNQRLNDGLSNNGILFPEIQEIFGNLSFDTVYDANTGTHRLKIDHTLGEKITEKISQVAEKSGFLMTAVENKINRRWTFEIGYTQKWKLDNANKNLTRDFEFKLAKELKRENREETVEDLRRSEKRDFKIFEKNDATEYQYRMEMWRRNRAENHANGIVNSLHYDYSITGKSKILTKPAGSVLGQFQHYGLNFFNMQRKIVRDGKDAVMSGQWDSAAGWRMYRLGILYATINGLASPLLNANFGNLVQNDTYERIKNYTDALSSDDEKRKQAFFGKGPFIGTFGGPFVSDLVSLGNVAGLYEMEEGELSAYLAGYQDWADTTGSKKLQELVRIGNTQMHRMIYSTGPKLKEGVNLGVVTQGTLGLFPNKDVREQRERLQNIPGIKHLVTPKTKEEPKKATRDFNKEIMQSLDSLQN